MTVGPDKVLQHESNSVRPIPLAGLLPISSSKLQHAMNRIVGEHLGSIHEPPEQFPVVLALIAPKDSVRNKR